MIWSQTNSKRTSAYQKSNRTTISSRELVEKKQDSQINDLIIREKLKLILGSFTNFYSD